MKFLITFVPVSRHSRRRTGKSKTEVIDTTQPPWKDLHIDSPARMEAVYEASNDVKVVDVRETA